MYGAYFAESSLTSFAIGTNRAPTAECVIRCFGEPEQYQAYYTFDIPGHALHFSLFFPDIGMIVNGVQFFGISQKKPPSISTKFAMDSFGIYSAGTLEDTLNQFIPPAYTDLYDEMLRDYKPWPEDWEDIMIDLKME